MILVRGILRKRQVDSDSKRVTVVPRVIKTFVKEISRDKSICCTAASVDYGESMEKKRRFDDTLVFQIFRVSVKISGSTTRVYNREAIIVIRGTARSQSVRKEREASGEGRRDGAHYSFGQFVERVGSGAARRWEMTPRYRFYRRLLPFSGCNEIHYWPFYSYRFLYRTSLRSLFSSALGCS